MMLGLTMIISFLLIAVLLILLPLGLSNKGKLLTLAVCALLGFMGYVGMNVFPLWQIVIIQISLAFLLSYIFDKRLQDSLYAENQDEEENLPEQDIPKPLFSMNELEEKAKGFETVDQYYSTVLIPSYEKKDHIKNEEQEIDTEITPTLEQISASEENLESDLIFEDFREEQTEELPEIERDFIIELPLIEEHLVEEQVGSIEEKELSELGFDGADDAEALMMARMRSFESVGHTTNAPERILTDEDSIEEIELSHKVESKIEKSNHSIELFDDLEELYKSRKQT
ncbi:hypothetical protein [Peribacillus alkalitolerans]|uniref:hypothetical protein n=1 Tax=Peribacillus alkalitolerans TaxID=1550385 RepID=UPI0013D676BD|nr:hypothetical protein [Peribacillus alkalitolerans]